MPRLSADFQPRLARALRKRTEPPHPFGRLLLGSYGAVSAVVSVVVMRSQGLEGTVIAGTMLGAGLLLAGVTRLVRRPLPFPAR